MKDDLRRNASGYIDEPCYQAVTAGPRPGEIYAHTMSSDYMLILATNGNVSACLKLEEKPREGKIRVLARVPMYIDPIKVCYCFPICWERTSRACRMLSFPVYAERLPKRWA